MTATSFRPAMVDRLTIVQIIQGIFSQSLVFRGALISDPRVGPHGEMIVDVSFDRGPVVFRVVAPSTEEAYAVLHELASAMVEVERGQDSRNINRRMGYEGASGDVIV